MSKLKTRPTLDDVSLFLSMVDNDARREDAIKLLDIFAECLPYKPVMWGTSIIGYGEYSYKQGNGKDANWMLTGFSPRKQNLAIYIMTGVENYPDLIKNLGKYKNGKSCLYVNKLADVDTEILKNLIKRSVEDMCSRYNVNS